MHVLVRIVKLLLLMLLGYVPLDTSTLQSAITAKLLKYP